MMLRFCCAVPGTELRYGATGVGGYSVNKGGEAGGARTCAVTCFPGTLVRYGVYQRRAGVAAYASAVLRTEKRSAHVRSGVGPYPLTYRVSHRTRVGAYICPTLWQCRTWERVSCRIIPRSLAAYAEHHTLRCTGHCTSSIRVASYTTLYRAPHRQGVGAYGTRLQGANAIAGYA
eukprot:958688-Rhodomonas_salina.1